jgi:hypothetical protein
MGADSLLKLMGGFAVTAIIKMSKFLLKKPLVTHDEPRDSSAAMKEVLSLVFQHTAEVFELIVGAVSEHYKIDKAEMMDVILKNPAYINKPSSVIVEVAGDESKPIKKKFSIKKLPSHPE